MGEDGPAIEVNSLEWELRASMELEFVAFIVRPILEKGDVMWKAGALPERVMYKYVRGDNFQSVGGRTQSRRRDGI